MWKAHNLLLHILAALKKAISFVMVLMVVKKDLNLHPNIQQIPMCQGSSFQLFPDNSFPNYVSYCFLNSLKCILHQCGKLTHKTSEERLKDI